MIATYHNHTTWSDGKASVAEVIDGAMALGVEELGISDHFNLHPSGTTPFWSMDPARVGEYADEVLSRGAQADLTIRLGLEVDWFAERREMIERALEALPLDYVIGAVHEVDGFRIDMGPEDWSPLSEDECNEKHRVYWQRITTMAESGLFDIVAHVDLPKKFGFHPTVRPSEEIEAALDAVAKAGMVLELNTAGWHKPCRDGYPTEEILRGCFARGIVVTMSADAHEPGHLTRDFDRAAARLKSVGYTEVARFAGRQMRLEPIDEAIPSAASRA